jgi:hypothetical protein
LHRNAVRVLEDIDGRSQRGLVLAPHLRLLVLRLRLRARRLAVALRDVLSNCIHDRVSFFN